MKPSRSAVFLGLALLTSAGAISRADPLQDAMTSARAAAAREKSQRRSREDGANPFVGNIPLERSVFGTLTEAAMKGEAEAAAMKARVETGGLIYQDRRDHSYRITRPIAADSGMDNIHLPRHNHFPGFEDYQLVADYHTHPCEPDAYSVYFSPSDVDGYMYGWKDIGFIVDMCAGHVHEFDPSVDNPRETLAHGYMVDRAGHATEGDYYLASGRVVGFIRVPRACEETGSTLEPIRFSTIDGAAKYALEKSYLCSADLVYGGVILENQTDHSFAVTAPITTHRAGGSGDIDLPALTQQFNGYRMVADYHTHACGRQYISAYFSASDAIVNQAFHIAGYMMDECRGNIFKFDPVQDPADDHVITTTDGKTIKLTSGHFDGWVDLPRLVLAKDLIN